MAHARLISAGVVAAAACSSAQTVPNWEPTYDMQRSTIVQPCNMSGFLEPISFYAQFGIVDIDWSNAKSTWVQPPMSCEEQLVNQVRSFLLSSAVSPRRLQQAEAVSYRSSSVSVSTRLIKL